MIFGKRYRALPAARRRLALKQNLRLERLEHRIVFAGLAPVAVNDVYEAVSNQTLEVAASGVLANDTDAEGDTLTALEFRGPSHGELIFNDDGSFQYTPDPDFKGIDGFLYQVSDGTSLGNLAAVTIRVSGANATPEGAADAYTVAEDGVLDVGSSQGLLANDSDADNDPLTAMLEEGPQHGTLELRANGSFTYVPDANYHGSDSFTYKVNDGQQASLPINVELTVTPVNDSPAGSNDNYATDEDVTLTVTVEQGLLANDNDLDGDELTVQLSSPPEHGQLELNADGSFSFIPEANFHGTDAFTYQVSDGESLSDLIVVQLTVNSINDAPVGENDSYAINEDETLTVAVEAGVLANDSDVDGDELTVAVVDAPQHGELTLNADGSFTYVPDADFHGTDAFTYQINDGETLSDLIAVELTVNPVNDTPVGENDSYAINEDETLSVAVENGVLANDSDVDGDSLTVAVVNEPQHGTLTLNPDGSFTYVPAANYAGTDAFTYQISDGTVVSELVAVELTVNAVNDAPVGENDSYTTNEDETLTVAVENGVLANDSDVDGDLLSVTVVDQPQHGTLTLNPDGSFTYVPAANYAGTDAFTYQISDGTVVSELVAVELTVNPVADAPVAADDSYTTTVNEALVVSAPGVLANDMDADGDALTASVVTEPQHGTLTLASDGSFIYEPDPDYIGADEFSYRASDSADGAVAVVAIQVRGINDRPRAVNDSYRVTGDGPLVVDAATGVLRNDTDPNGDALSAVLFRGPRHGTLELNSDGSFTYTPESGFNGIDSFLYRAHDGELRSRLAVVTLRITPGGPAVASASALSQASATKESQAAPPVNLKAVDAFMDAASIEDLLAAEFDGLVPVG